MAVCTKRWRRARIQSRLSGRAAGRSPALPRGDSRSPPLLAGGDFPAAAALRGAAPPLTPPASPDPPSPPAPAAAGSSGGSCGKRGGTGRDGTRLPRRPASSQRLPLFGDRVPLRVLYVVKSPSPLGKHSQCLTALLFPWRWTAIPKARVELYGSFIIAPSPLAVRNKKR